MSSLCSNSVYFNLFQFNFNTLYFVFILTLLISTTHNPLIFHCWASHEVINSTYNCLHKPLFHAWLLRLPPCFRFLSLMLPKITTYTNLLPLLYTIDLLRLLPALFSADLGWKQPLAIRNRHFSLMINNNLFKTA